MGAAAGRDIIASTLSGYGSLLDGLFIWVMLRICHSCVEKVPQKNLRRFKNSGDKRRFISRFFSCGRMLFDRLLRVADVGGLAESFWRFVSAVCEAACCHHDNADGRADLVLDGQKKDTLRKTTQVTEVDCNPFDTNPGGRSWQDNAPDHDHYPGSVEPIRDLQPRSRVSINSDAGRVCSSSLLLAAKKKRRRNATETVQQR